MKLFSFLLVVMLAAGLTQVAFGQGDWQQYVLNGNGARAAGMGYAFTGLADDATAISWNSAGLTQLYETEASIIARFGGGSLDPQYDDVDVEVTTGSKFQLNFASLAIPFSAGNLNVVGGLAYRRVMDFTQNYEIKVSVPGFGEAISKTDNSGGVDAITPAVGVQLNDMISAGVAVNILMGSTDYLSETSGLLGDSKYESTDDYSGVGVDVGVLVKPSPQVQLGANLNMPQTITITEKMDGGDFEYKLKIPFSFSIGAAFRASDDLTIAADYRSRPWSSATYEAEGEEVTLGDWGAENANSFHVGLEYLAQAGSSVMPLRVGFYTLPTPGTDEKDDQITFSAFTAGLGIIMGNLILDGSFEYISGTFAGATDDMGNGIDFKQSDYRVTIGGTVHFGKN